MFSFWRTHFHMVYREVKVDGFVFFQVPEAQAACVLTSNAPDVKALFDPSAQKVEFMRPSGVSVSTSDWERFKVRAEEAFGKIGGTEAFSKLPYRTHFFSKYSDLEVPDQ